MLISFDTETTGLDSSVDEILTLSMVDADGNTLFDGRFKPSRAAEWPDAQKVNGIDPASVAELPGIAAYLPALNALFAAADEIVAYNAPFDLRFIEAAGIELNPAAVVHDAMLEFAEAIAVVDAVHGDWKWHKLTFAANVAGHKWDGRAHESVADARAALTVHKWSAAFIESEPDPGKRYGRYERGKLPKFGRETCGHEPTSRA